MQNINIDFATKRDKHFLLDNSKLPHEMFDRKYQNKEILIAKIDKQPVGFLVLDYIWYHIPFISFIWVDSESRKSGIGFTLLAYLEKHLSETNNDMLLSSSEETAIQAQAWHRRMGFKECGFISEINDDNTGEVFFRKSLKR